MADGTHGPDNPSTPPPSFDDLTERPDASPSRQQGEPSSPRRSQGGCRTLLLRIAYWSGTGLGLLGALVLLVIAGAISSQHQARLEEQAQVGFDAQQDITAAQQGSEDLPGQSEAERWLHQATTVGESVAEAQNTYLEHSGPLPLDDLPSRTPGLGERDECASYLDEVPTDTREYTDKELTTCAKGLREEATDGLERRLIPHFATHVLDTNDFNAVGRWHSGVPTLESDTSLAEHTWTAHEARVFEQDLSIPLVWTLTDGTGQMVAWVHGTYDPLIKKFDRMVFGTVAISDTGEDSAATDGADTDDDAVDEDTGDDSEDRQEDEGEGDQG